MVAAGSPESGRLARVRPTKGLFLILSVLVLVSVTNSMMSKDYLKIIQEYYEGGLMDAADKKKEFENQLTVVSQIFEEEMEKFHPMLNQVKTATANSTSLKGLLSSITNLLVNKRKDFAKSKKAHQEEIDDIWNFIKAVHYGEDSL